MATMILGVGLAMAAALFPAGIKANENSTRDTIGTIICKNGITIARAMLVDGDVTDEITLIDCSSEITDQDNLKYPIGADDTRRGFLILARRAADVTANDYQLVVVSYVKSDVDNDVEALDLTSSGYSINAGQTTFYLSAVTEISTADRTKIVGSPLIASDGKYATIIEIDGTKAVLDHPVDEDNPSDISFVIVETDSGDIAGVASPAMTVMVTRTALRSQ